MNCKNRVDSHIVLSVALLLAFSCKTPGKPEPKIIDPVPNEESVFPLFSDSGAVQMLVFQRGFDICAYDLLNKEEHILIHRGDTAFTNEKGYVFTREFLGRAIWHPDGEFIIYEEEYGIDEGHLQALDVQSGEYLFGNVIDAQDNIGDITHDGEILIFSSALLFAGTNYEIFSMPLDGLEKTRLTYRPLYDDTNPTIHPNDVDILFESREGAEGVQIYHTTLEGDSCIQITIEGYRNMTPNFNPNTGEVVFLRSESSAAWNTIWKASDMTFTDIVQLTDSGYVNGWPQWSNDGSKIIYTRFTRDRWLIYSEPEIWMMNGDGSGKEKLIQNGRNGSLYIRE